MTLRGWLAVIAAVLAFLAGAFLLGRTTAPAKVEERERIVFKDRVRVEHVRDERAAKSAEMATNTRVVTRWVRVTTPDGGTREEMATDTAAATATKTAEATKVTERSATEREVFQDLSRERIVTRPERTDYGVTVLGGWSRLQARPNVVGLVAERRIIGGLSLGLWATTQRSGGLAVGLRW